jgi:hypothetical protein
MLKDVSKFCKSVFYFNTKLFSGNAIALTNIPRRYRSSYELLQGSGDFDEIYYYKHYPDVESKGVDPIAHYLIWGAAEYRNPSADFDTEYYIKTHKDVADSGVNPLVHYVKYGKNENRSVASAGMGMFPTRLFDNAFYLSAYPDVAAAGVDPISHYLISGYREGRDPNRFFSSSWYTFTNQDVLDPETNPLKHYANIGWKEGRDPHPNFSVGKYLAHNTDVATAEIDPLLHYLTSGEKEGRQTFASSLAPAMSEIYHTAHEISAAAIAKMREDGMRSLQRHFGFQPLNVVVDPVSNRNPSLLILLPGLNRRYATGGPNTAYILGCLIAAEGISVKFVSVDAPPDHDLKPLKEHLHKLTGFDVDELGIEFLDGHARDLPIILGVDDFLVATAWWTAQPAKAATALLKTKRFGYLIQDYESMFYGLSVLHAGAEETYSYDHIPIINTSLLRDHLIDEKVGRFSDPEFASRALCFEPAVDSAHFYPVARNRKATRKLLFYTRPTMAERNLFWLGVAALKAAVLAGAFGESGWEFTGMGEHFEPIPLGRGYVLRPAEWMDFAGYAEMMREADLLLSLMLSPHPSYPPLEFAACGGVVVTTEYGSKTAERMANISANIIAVPATLDELVPALVRGILLREKFSGSEISIPLPTSWMESLSKILPDLVAELGKEGLLPDRGRQIALNSEEVAGGQPVSLAVSSLTKRALRRRANYLTSSDEVSISVVTFVENLASIHRLLPSIRTQLSDINEWIIVVRPNHFPQAAASVKKLANNDKIRVLQGDHSDLTTCAEQASGRYLLVLDPGGAPTFDAFGIFRAFAEQAEMPNIVVSDDYNTSSDAADISWMMKTGWDPVLCVHSREIPGMIAFRRDNLQKLLNMNIANSSESLRWPDFVIHKEVLNDVVHLQEILWLGTKSIVAPTDIPTRLAAKPIDAERQIETLLLGEVIVAEKLRQALAKTKANTKIIHLRSAAVQTGSIEIDSVVSLFDTFDDTVMVGGSVDCDGVEMAGGVVFGYDGLFGVPFNGSAVKPATPYTVNAVSAQLCWVSRDHLLAALTDMPEEFGLPLLGLWLGLIAAEEGKRVIFSPHLRAKEESNGGSSSLSVADRAYFADRYKRQVIKSRGYGSNLNFDGRYSFEISSEPYAPSSLLKYDSLVPTVRSQQKMQESGKATIGIITTVYIRTDPDVFLETVESVFAQTHPVYEWVILENGPIPDSVDAILKDLEINKRVNILRCPKNLGIHGGTRMCLENASADFLMVLDADDLLVAEAVETVSQAIQANPTSEIFYTDEDLLIGGKPIHPFYRSDYDPVHLRAHSFIWHAIVFRRMRALELGVFTSAETEYAQDWDNLLRFELAGFHPLHIPKVIYHWRQHQSSLSNSGSTFQGSLDSVRGALERVKMSQPRPDLYEVVPFPGDMGAEDFYLQRLGAELPSFRCLHLAHQNTASRVRELASAQRLSVSRGVEGCAALKEALLHIEEDFVCLLGPDVSLWEDKSIWQAFRHFEMVTSVCAVGGPVSDRAGEIVRGAGVQVGADMILDPYIGRSMLERGGDMISRLKPVSVTTLNVDLLIVRRTILLQVLDDASPSLPLRNLGAWIGIWAQERSLNLIYEPLLRGQSSDLASLLSDQTSEKTILPKAGGTSAEYHPKRTLRGLAPIIAASRVHYR